MKYEERMKLLEETRQKIKRKKIRFDETKDNFGFERMNLLSKVKNTSEVKGYPFECYNKGEFKFALKIIPNEIKFVKANNPSRLEIEVLKVLTNDLVSKGITPHIVYYLTNLKVLNRCQALKCIDIKRLEASELIHKNSYVLVSEYISGGSIDEWLYNRCEESKDPSTDEWREIIFQILYTLLVFQNKYRGNHNDSHYGNILMDTSVESGGYYVYELTDTKGVTTRYYIKNRGVIPKLWDFEFSMVYSDKIDLFPNKFVIGSLKYDSKEHKTIEEYSESEDKYAYAIPVQYSEIYDAHFFICSLLDLILPQEVFDWIIGVYPEEVIPPERDSTGSYTSYMSETDTDSLDSLVSSRYTSTSLNDVSSMISQSISVSENDTTDVLEYLEDGRLINGRTEHLNLPSTLLLLKDDFFQVLKIKPSDFTEKDSVIFKYMIV